eukprot:5698707-Amphidinium_carterae.1
MASSIANWHRKGMEQYGLRITVAMGTPWYRSLRSKLRQGCSNRQMDAGEAHRNRVPRMAKDFGQSLAVGRSNSQLFPRIGFSTLASQEWSNLIACVSGFGSRRGVDASLSLSSGVHPLIPAVQLRTGPPVLPER